MLILRAAIAWIANVARGFVHATRGILLLVATQRNARIHCAATVMTLGAAFWTHRTAHEWGLLVAAMALVWASEALNSSIEQLANRLVPDCDPAVRNVKDLAAAAVLLAAAASVALAVAAFWRGPWTADAAVGPGAP